MEGSQPTPTPTPGQPAPTPAPQPTPTPDPSPTPAQPGSPEPGSQPASRHDARIREAVAAQRAAEEQAAAEKKRADDLERAQLSEKERAERERDEAIAERDRLKTEAQQLKRGGEIRSVAAVADGERRPFANPENAVAMLHARFGDLDSPEKVKEAVNQLAAENPHLLAPAETPPQPTVPGFGTLPGSIPPPATPAPGGELTPEQAKDGIAADIGAVLSRRR